MIGQEEFDLSSGKKLNCIGKFAPEKSCFLLNSVANRRQTKKVHRAPMKLPSLAQPNLGRCTIIVESERSSFSKYENRGLLTAAVSNTIFI